MRHLIAVLILSSAATVLAQDAAQMAMQANQQAMEAAQQANQQAMQFAQQASQQAAQFAQQASQQAMDASQPSYCCGEPVAKPNFSQKAGKYGSATITVRIKDKTRRTAIYYTTDGWTPTIRSTRYVGPITISSTTTLQAIGVGPNLQYSPVMTATYTLPNAVPSVSETASTPAAAAPAPHASSVGGPVLLKRGTPIPIVFTAAVTSKGRQIGDALPVALAGNLVVDGMTVASKTDPVLATVTEADSKGLAGSPGILSFAVRSISIGGQTVPLSGEETMEGQARRTAAQALMLIPGVGVSGIFVHGHDAEIPQGAKLTAYVDRDTTLSPANGVAGAKQP